MIELEGFSLRGSTHNKNAVIAPRVEEEQWIRRMLDPSRYRLPVTVVGPRQSGKSTFLKGLQTEFSCEGRLAAYVTLEELRGLNTNELENRLWPLIGEQVATQIPRIGNPSQFREDKHAIRLDEQLKTLDHRPTLLFDEFSYVALNYSWLAQLRGKIERGVLPYQIVFADRAHPKQYPSEGFSPFNNTAVIYLKDFSPEVFTSFLQKCAEKNGVSVTDEQAAKLYAQHNGQPYLAQTAGHRLVYQAVEERASTPTDKHLSVVLASMEQDARTTSLEIYSAFTEYLQHGTERGIQCGCAEKRELSYILQGQRIRFDQHGPTGVLFTLGFIVPEVQEYKFGEWRLEGDAKIRNPLYTLFLRSHRTLLH
jgi:hypothetical protein